MLSLPLDPVPWKDQSPAAGRSHHSKQWFYIRSLCTQDPTRSYLMRDEHDHIVERPQYMLMRVAAPLYETVDEIVNCHKALSAKEYTHATPTLFNAGMPKGQYASCFLGCMQDDSILGISNTVKQCALISKTAGGIGLSISNIRSTGSHIQGAMGKSMDALCFESLTRQQGT